jgi:hypothetical protein
MPSIPLTGIAGTDYSTGIVTSETGLVTRRLEQWADDIQTVQARGVYVEDFGTVTATSDDTAAFQAACTSAITNGGAVILKALPAGTRYRLTAPIVLPQPVRIIGEGWTIDTSVSPSIPGVGSWIHLDHTGEGFYFRDDAHVGVYYPGGGLYDVGIYRNQPAPGVGWTPTAASADIRVEGRVDLINVMHLCSTKGVLVRSAGVLTTDRHRGQFFTSGVEVERSADLQRFNNAHYWPFWSQDANVLGYTIDNASGFYTRRADGLELTNCFTYAMAWLLNHLDNPSEASGLASCKITNAYADACGGAIKVVASNFQARVSINGIEINADSLVRGTGSGIDLSGAVQSFIDVDGLTVTRAHQSGVSATGAAHIVNVSAQRMKDWDRLGVGGVGAFSCDNAAVINIVTVPSFSGPATQYATGTNGIINVWANSRRGYSLLQTGYYTTRATIANDSVTTVAAPAGNLTAMLHLFPATVPAAGSPAGIYWVRATASPSILQVSATTTTNVTLSTGVKTGTSGIVGNLTISPASDGLVYIENRTGASLTFTFTMVGS